MSILFGWIIPYIVMIVFLVGLIHRLATWLHVPVPFKLTVFPAPATTGGAVLDLAKEALGFRSLWRGNKGLWFAAWLFHISLAVVLIGHFFGILCTGRQFMMFGAGAGQSELLSVTFGTYAGISLLIGLLILTMRRVVSPVMRFISTTSDFLTVFLILAIACSGMYMRCFADVSYVAVHHYLGGLITLHPVLPPANPAFLIHITLVELFLLYFPFSKLMHACGIFISRWLITRPFERQVLLK